MTPFAIGRLIILFTLIAASLAVILNYPDHIFGSWELHARTHIFQAVVWALGLNILGIIVALKFIGKEKWAVNALIIIGLFVFGGYFLPHLITPNPLGEPAGSDGWLGFGVMTIAYITGLYLSKKH